ncbi:MAG: PIN/TRAM domain-containing protein [Dethiobacteria bacterium]|nr:PIN/TRAM domain-containing protein [Bacillota bacterium]HPT34883.1 PIN/TRAM domain-containing protein [Bacillota bacterium]
MAQKIVRIVGTLIGIILGALIFKDFGPFFVSAVGGAISISEPLGTSISSVLGGSFMGLIFYFLSPLTIKFYNRFMNWCDSRLKTVPTQDIVLVSAALIVALLMGMLLSFSVNRIPYVGPYIAPLLTLLLAVIGVRFLLNRKEDFAFLTSIFNRNPRSPAAADNETYKILDTSAIIDGRIVDICKTGFLEGVIVVAGFVLEELRHIADSPDLLKRNRGRRGLDILNKIQKEMDIPVQIYEGDFEDLNDVDSKLVRLAKVINGKIITNDFNLNKVCELQGIPVLNINELANAVKPVVLPGEEMTAQIIKDGKEPGQGVAYLDDGTMIVVEGGRRYIGDSIDVLVTSVLQTAAGRMIFAKPKQAAERVTGVK